MTERDRTLVIETMEWFIAYATNGEAPDPLVVNTARRLVHVLHAERAEAEAPADGPDYTLHGIAKILGATVSTDHPDLAGAPNWHTTPNGQEKRCKVCGKKTAGRLLGRPTCWNCFKAAYNPPAADDVTAANAIIGEAIADLDVSFRPADRRGPPYQLHQQCGRCSQPFDAHPGGRCPK